MPNEKVMLLLFFIGMPLFSLLFCLFPFMVTVVTLGICLLLCVWCMTTDSSVHINDLKESISNRLKISFDDILFDFNKKNTPYLKPGNYTVFTPKGEFLLELHSKPHNFYSIELIQISDVNFIDELNIRDRRDS